MIDPVTGEPVAEPAPQPFSPQSVRSPGSGCGKPLLIGCGVLLVVIGAAAILFIVKAKDLFGFLMEKTQEAIVEELSDEVTAQDRERLERAFAAAGEVILSGDADPEALQQAQRQLSETLQKAGNGDGISRDEALGLIRTLERLAGIEAPVEVPAEPEEPEAPSLLGVEASVPIPPFEEGGPGGIFATGSDIVPKMASDAAALVVLIRRPAQDLRKSPLAPLSRKGGSES